jgi:hypothetical protein
LGARYRLYEADQFLHSRASSPQHVAKLNQHGGFDGPHGIEVKRRRTQESETAGEENNEASQRCGAHRQPRQEGRRRQAARASGGETEDRGSQGEARAQEDRTESSAEKSRNRGTKHSGTAGDGTQAHAQYERPSAEACGPATAASSRRRAERAAEAADAAAEPIDDHRHRAQRAEAGGKLAGADAAEAAGKLEWFFLSTV